MTGVGRPAARIAPWLAVAAVLLVLLARQSYTPDLWTHLFLGREAIRTLSVEPPDALLLHQANYQNVSWGFQVVLWGAYRAAGFAGIAALFSALWLAAFGLWARTCRAFEAPVVGAPLALVVVLICQIRFEERPEVASIVLLALVLDLLREDVGRARWIAMACAQVVWANVHGYFVLGPAIAALRLATLVLATPRASWAAARAARTRLAAVTLTLLLASLVSPYGPGAWSNALRLGGLLAQLRTAVDELRPPVGPYLGLWTVKLFWVYAALAAAAAVAHLVRRGRQGLFASLLAASGLALAATSLRNIPLAVFLAAPLWGEVLPSMRALRWGAGPRSERLVAVAVSAAAVALVVATGGGWLHRSLDSPSRFGIGPRAGAFPERAARYLAETRFHGTVFNHPDDGGYLEYHVPGIRPYGDARFVEPGPVREYFEALTSMATFRRLDSRLGFDAVLLDLPRGQFSLFALLEDPRWKLVHGDPHRALLANTARAAGAAAPIRTPRFFLGEDLSDKPDGLSAIRWTDALARLGRDDLLLLQLRELGNAGTVPSPVLEFALARGAMTGNGAITRAASALRPKMLALTREDAARVDAWLAR